MSLWWPQNTHTPKLIQANTNHTPKHIRPGCRGLQLGCSCIRNVALQQHIHNDRSTSAAVPASLSTPTAPQRPWPLRQPCPTHCTLFWPGLWKLLPNPAVHTLYPALCEDNADVIVLLLCGLELMSAQGGNLLLVHASFLTHDLSSCTLSNSLCKSVASYYFFFVRLSPEPNS